VPATIADAPRAGRTAPELRLAAVLAMLVAATGLLALLFAAGAAAGLLPVDPATALRPAGPLCITLLGWSLLELLQGRVIRARVAAVAVAGVLGIIALLWLNDPYPAAGRPGPFGNPLITPPYLIGGLLGAATLAGGTLRYSEELRAGVLWAGGVAGLMLVAAVAVDSLFGLGRVAWGGAALEAGFAVIVPGMLATAIFLAGWGSVGAGRVRRLPLAAALVLALAALVVWIGLAIQSREAEQRLASGSLLGMQHLLLERLDLRVKALGRMANRLAAAGPRARERLFQLDARPFLEGYSGLEHLAWTNRERNVVYETGESRPGAASDLAARAATYDAAARGQPQLSAPLRLASGEEGTLVVVPVRDRDGDPWYLEADLGYWSLLGRPGSDLAVRLSDGAEAVAGPEAGHIRHAAAATFDTYGRRWHLQIGSARGSRLAWLPELVLGSGLLGAALLGVVLQLGLIARRREGSLQTQFARYQAAQNALRESERKANQILESTTDAVFIIDPEARVTYANPQAGRVLRQATADLVGARLWDKLPALQRPGIENACLRALQEQVVVAVQDYYPPLDAWLEFRAYPHPDGAAVFFRDVSDQQRSFDRLVRSEQSLARAQRIARLGGWELDLESDELRWSDQVYELFGLRREDFPRTFEAMLDRLLPGDRERLRDARQEAQRSGNAIDVEHRIVMPSGEVRWMHARATPARGFDGRPMLSGTVQDITERRRTEVRLRRLAESLLRTQQIAHVGSWEHSPGTARLSCSHETLRIWGLDAQPGSLEDFVACVHPEDRERLEKARARAMDSGLPSELEYRIRQPDGSVRSIREVSAPVADESGRNAMLAGAVQDVTELRKAEQALLSALGRAERQAAQLRALNRAAVQASHMIGAPGLMQFLIDDLRATVGAHQGLASLVSGGDWSNARHSISLSAKYAKWREATVQIDGTGIYGLVCEQNESVCMTQAELGAHPRWRGDDPEQPGRPPLRGWLAVPLVGSDGRNMGMLQLSDKHEGEFTAEDEAIAAQYAQMAAAALERDGLVAQLRDAQETLEEKLANLEAIAHSIGDGVYAIDTKGRVSFLNPAAERLLGWGQGELYGNDAERRLYSSERERAPGLRVLDSRAELAEPDAVMLTRSGRHLEASIIATPLRAGGRLLGAVVAFRDLAPIREAQRAIAQRDRFFQISLDMFAIAAEDGRLLQVNSAFTRVLGYDEQTLLAMPSIDLVHPEDRKASLAALAQLREGQEVTRFVNRVRCADGSYRWFEWATMPVEGKVHYTVARDITQRRRMEEALQKTLDDLQSRNRELEDFAFVASHDLQEPLRKIRAFSDRLATIPGLPPDGKAVDYLQRIASAAARMQRLIDDLLAYSRVTTRARPFERVPLRGIVADVLLDLETRLEETLAAFRVGELPEIEADATQMRQLFQNLLGNALKFAAKDRRLEVLVKAEADVEPATQRPVTRITIQDNGIGFDARYAERIFSPFQRLHSRSEYEGTGMGLAIVRRIVERHGGRIEARGAPGAGAVFIVTLPQRQSRRGAAVVQGELP